MGGGKEWGGGTRWEVDVTHAAAVMKHGLHIHGLHIHGLHIHGLDTQSIQLTISSTWPSLRLDPPCVLSPLKTEQELIHPVVVGGGGGEGLG